MENLDVSRGLFIVTTEIGTRYVASGPDPANPAATRPAKAVPRTETVDEETESLPLELFGA